LGALVLRVETSKSVRETVEEREVREKLDRGRESSPDGKSSERAFFRSMKKESERESDGVSLSLSSKPSLLFPLSEGKKDKTKTKMRGSRVLAVLIAFLAAALAAWIGGGGGSSNGGVLTRLMASSSKFMHRSIPHCSLLETTSPQRDFVIAAERVVLPDGVFPAASESLVCLFVLSESEKIARVFFLARIVAGSHSQPRSRPQ
jgi:hypothetical protein